MNLRNSLALTVICFILGVGLVAQLRARRSQTTSNVAAQDQSALLGSLVVANAELRSEVQKLESEMSAYDRSSDSTVPQMQSEVDRMHIVNGDASVSGPGVEVVIGSGVSAVDLQDVVNELRNVGAEAISLNGIRLVTRSSLSGDSSGVVLDRTPLYAPFVFQVIGDPTTMSTALNRRGGELEILRVLYQGVQVNMRTVNRLLLPAGRLPATNLARAAAQ